MTIISFISVTRQFCEKEVIMNRFLKLIAILFAVSLLALRLTGCMESGSFMAHHVDSPSDGTSIKIPTINVNGKVVGTQSAEARVTINTADVAVKDGKRSTDVVPVEGKKIIAVGATVSRANLKEQVTVNYVPAK